MKIEREINWSTMENIGQIVSNFNHDIDRAAESRLKERAGHVYAEYPALNFFAHITYLDGSFYARVYRFYRVAENIDKGSVEDIMEYLCGKYGDL